MEGLYLAHYGTRGQKWGIRRYQNPDGSLTEAGKKRYSNLYNDMHNAKYDYKDAKKQYSKDFKEAYKYSSRHAISQHFGKNKATSNALWGKAYDSANAVNEAKKKYKDLKTQRKVETMNARDEMRDNAKISDRLIFGDRMFKDAAKYVVDNGMTYQDAIKKSKNDAIINSVLSLIGAVPLQKISDKVANKF